MVTTLNIEVGDYTVDNTALISLNSTINNDTDIILNLINSGVAEQLTLDFKDLQPSSFQNFIIECASQCYIDILNTDNITIASLNITNVVFTKQLDLTLENFYMSVSEAVKVILPSNIKQAEIRVLPSNDMLAVQQLLRSVDIIPGSGEYVYDTKLQYKKETNGYQGNKFLPINANNPEGIADSLYNLKSLKRLCPNLEWTAPVVSWFGVLEEASLDIANLTIMPAVEHREEKTFENWRVEDYSRANAHEISKDAEDRPNYGGTVNDASLVRYMEALREAGYKIMFYPMIFMDTPGKPWRGHLTAANTTDIHKFFTQDGDYNRFILHYANLLKGKIDAFVIGSELRDLTAVIDDHYSYPDPRRYPTVVELIDLARLVKQILGQKVTITYAADWSEYHHDQHGYHHLDALWASTDIDVVGIDAYLPLTGKNMGDITSDEIKQGWQSGELWDYYYYNNKKESISPEWGLKQIEHWWQSEHWSYSIKSQWQPKMKPIWFTEFGFPSIHMATNQPNVFYSPGTSDGGVPKESSGKPDFNIQMRAIRATIEYWQTKSDMVQNMFLWTWDARPYPVFPERLDIWSDGFIWSRGHWINGKIEPTSRVILSADFNFNVSKLVVYAQDLIIPSIGPKSNADIIIANDIHIQGPLQGNNLGIRASKLILPEAIVISLNGTLMFDVDNPIKPSIKKKIETRIEQYNKKIVRSYEDESITPVTIDVDKFIVKAPSLKLSATKLKANKIELYLNELELESELENHLYREKFQGKRHWLTNKASSADRIEQKQVAITTHISCQDLKLQLDGNLYAHGALIETTSFSGYAKNYLFESLTLESSHEICAIKRKWGGFKSPKKIANKGYDEYLHGAVLLIAGKGYAFSENGITFLGSYLIGQEVNLEAKNVNFKAAIGKHYEAFKIEEKGIKFFANSKEGEIALGVSAYYKSSKSQGYYEQATQAGAFVKKLTMTTHILERDGAIISGENITINAKQIIDKSPVVMSYYHLQQQSLELGLKVGIQESISKAIAAGKNLFSNVGDNNPALISAVNFVSNNQALFMQLSNVAEGKAVQGGVWLYGEAKSKHLSSRQSNAITNPIDAKELTVNANYWRMQGLEGTGDNWYINVNKIEAEVSEDLTHQSFGNNQINGQFSLYGNVGHGAGFQTNQFTSDGATRHANNINLKGNLNIKANEITGTLRMEADDITAIVDVLKLISAQDERHQSVRVFDAHIGAAGGSVSGAGAYGQRERSDSYITNDGRGGLKGRNLLLVRATELLYLEGAYLDTDNGHLRIEAAKITTKAIIDSKAGWIKGLGIDQGNKAFSRSERLVAGENDEVRAVYGAIGKGIIIIGDQQIDETMSELLGISRNSGLDELKGKEWKLDATFRKSYNDELKKLYNSKDVANKIINNAAEATSNAISPLKAIWQSNDKSPVPIADNDNSLDSGAEAEIYGPIPQEVPTIIKAGDEQIRDKASQSVTQPVEGVSQLNHQLAKGGQQVKDTARSVADKVTNIASEGANSFAQLTNSLGTLGAHLVELVNKPMVDSDSVKLSRSLAKGQYEARQLTELFSLANEHTSQAALAESLTKSVTANSVATKPNEAVSQPAKPANSLSPQQQQLVNDLQAELAKVRSADDLVLIKQANEAYVIIKHSADAALLVSKDQLVAHFPELASKLAALSEVAAELVGATLSKLDGKLTSLGGAKYEQLKQRASELLEAMDEQAPLIVSDGVKLITLGAGGKLLELGFAQALAGITSKLKLESASKPGVGGKLKDELESTSIKAELKSETLLKSDDVTKPTKELVSLKQISPQEQLAIVKLEAIVKEYNYPFEVKIYRNVDPSLIKKQIELPTDYNDPKLRDKFRTHGKDFGVGGLNFNKRNADLFKQGILDHINDPNTIIIVGEYTTGNVGTVIHYYNPTTKINVMKDTQGKFVSGWELTEGQKDNVLIHGKLGGKKR